MIKRITSIQNPIIKQLIQQREKLPSIIKEQHNGPILIHGQKMVDECITHYQLKASLLITSNESNISLYDNKSAASQLIVTTDSIIQRVCNVQSTNGLCATFQYPPPNSNLLYSDTMDIEQAYQKFISSRRIVVINELQDTGNLGTILRSSYSFGYDCVVVLNNSVSPFNEKVIRSSRTVLFDLPLIMCSKETFVNWLQKTPDMKCIVSTCDKSDNIQLSRKMANDKLHSSKHLCIMVNSEHEGRELEFNTPALASKIHYIHIPMARQYDSLNVSQVAAILLHCFQ
jgi:TrmH family RNA methyltransferase